MSFLDTILGDIRSGAPSWSYTLLLLGWRLLTVLTLITVGDMAIRLFRPDHGLKP